MISALRRRGLFILALILSSAHIGAAPAAEGRDALWHIVRHCIDSSAANYCRVCAAPRADSACAANAACRDTTEVWAQTEDYVAIRDRKSCGCPQDFVHGLALPYARVIGVEDRNRPEGIWAFAWRAAEQRIDDRLAIALIVNSPASRSQDQLHVHMLRLRPGARAQLSAMAVRLESLASVWAAAAHAAIAAGLGDGYGVLVMNDPGGGYLLVVDAAPLERRFGAGSCR